MLHLKVVTPEGMLIDEDVHNVVLPIADGQATIYPKHLPLLGALQPGVLAYRPGADAKDGEPIRIAVREGFAEVGAHNHVTVVTEAARRPDELDRDVVVQELKNAQSAIEQFKGRSDSSEGRLLRESLEWARTRHRLISN